MVLILLPSWVVLSKEHQIFDFALSLWWLRAKKDCYVQVCLGLIKSYQKKYQIRLDPELVIGREQREYSAFQLSLLQNLYIPAKSRFQSL